MTETGKPVAQIANDLGINETTPASWVARPAGLAGPGQQRECGTLAAAAGEPELKWLRRPLEPTEREARRAVLAERIRSFFDRSGRTYGSPRITLDLGEGWQVPQNTVAEIMAELTTTPLKTVGT
ncbi:IS3 family transposase [Streptomyces iranensis]|uniref:IS3 family transposase n=1 Tax=Streptomyces iranensis TaxID=576784 RepID=UPI0039B7821C